MALNPLTKCLPNSHGLLSNHRLIRQLQSIANKITSINDVREQTQHENHHCYMQISQWKTKEQVTSDLFKSVVQKTDGIICINKPYGLRVQPLILTAAKDVPKKIEILSGYEYPHSMKCSLENLKNLVQEEILILSKSPERYSSGVTLISTSEDTNARILKSLARTKAMKQPPYKYLMIAVGIPKSQETTERVGITLLTVNKTTNEKAPIIVNSFSKRKMFDGEIKPAIVQCRVLSKNKEKNVSLLEIATTCTKYHFLRVYPTYRGVSILGDNLHGGRTNWVFDKPVNIDVTNSSASEPQRLSDDILRSLKLTKELRPILPVHLHLHQVVLPKFSRGKDLTFEAPVPNHFSWTLERLGLNTSSS